MKTNRNNGIVYYTFPHFTAAGAIRHAFSTRIGGVSEGHFASMNLGLHSGDNSENVVENYRLFCAAAGFDMHNIAMGGQQHSTNIRIVAGVGYFNCTDGLITAAPGIVLTTYFADCAALLYYDPVNRVIGNAHAGWRGSMHNMAGKMVAEMKAFYGCHPENILVGIGPSISCDNFEVDPEVADEFKLLLPFSASFIYNSKSAANKYHIDLWGINRGNLLAAGVLPDNIHVSGMCTFGDKTHFYSHRRDGKARGSLAAFIELRADL